MSQAAAAAAAENGGAAAENGGPISVIGGIGGEAVAAKRGKKKRTPGEIRIQKGDSSAHRGPPSGPSIILAENFFEGGVALSGGLLVIEGILRRARVPWTVVGEGTHT